MQRPSNQRKMLLIVAATLLTTACESGPTIEEETERADNAERNVAFLQSKLEEINSQLSEVENEHSNLSSAIDRFGYEDWTSVVPDVQSAETDLESEISEMRSQIDQ
jgi:peptidoglycan hydrolase CwlO-like protein